jgi:hypothetical protein
MALTITHATDYAPAYNPVMVSAVSTVRDDFTLGSAKTITVVTNASGYVQLTFSASHNLIQGDFVLITSAPGTEGIETVGYVTSVPTGTSLVTNIPYITGLSSNGTAYKYIKNYSCIVKFYIYIASAPSTALLAATKLVRPKFVAGFCNFDIDLSGLIQSYNYEGFAPSDVLSSDLYTSGVLLQKNRQSFVKYGYELFEASDSPIGGEAEFIENIPSA